MFEFIGLLAPDGTVLDANEPALRFIGATPDEVLGKAFWDTPWWSHSPAEQDRLKQAVADAARGGFSRFETEHIGRDGQRMRLDFSLTPYFDDSGTVTYLIPEGRDVTQRQQMEEELRNTLAQYKALLASTFDPIVTIDDCGIIQTASDSIERVFGYTSDEILGRNISILMPESHQTSDDDCLDQYRATGETHILGNTRELVARRKDGEVFPIELSVSRVSVPSQSRTLYIGIIHDITERKQSENEIQLLQNLTMAISTEPDLDSAFVVAIKSICRATGWDYGEVWMPSDDRQAVVAGPGVERGDPAFERFQRQSQGVVFVEGEGLVGRVWASKQPEWIEDIDLLPAGSFQRREAAKEAGFKAALAVPILRNNEVVAILAFFMRQHRNEDRRLVALVSAAVAPLGPVVQRKEYEDALRESERWFRQVLNDVEVLAVMLDRDGCITFVDDFLLLTTGWKRHEIMGRNWFDLFIAEDERARVRAVFLRGLETGQIDTQYENDIMTRNGTRRRIAWSNTMMHDADGTVIGATAFGVDVTEQRHVQAELDRHRQQLEELVEQRTAELEETHEQLRLADRLASIGTLATGLGHDMNNILLPARCNLDVLESAVTSSENKQQIAFLRWSLNYLQQLTDGLRLFALDPDDGQASEAATSITTWWEQVGPLLSQSARHAQFSATLGDDLPLIAVPPHRLTQAVLNLIVNAGESVEANGLIRLRVRATKDRRFIRLSVADNGCGMSSEVKRRALDPFFTTKTRGLGTGLGLSLVRGVAQSAGGWLRIHSTEGRGTSVILMLPTAPETSIDPDQHVEPVRGMTAMISIVDSRAASFLATMLQSEGFEVCIDDPSSPPACSMWIAEPTVDRESVMRRYNAGNEVRLVTFGRSRDSELVRNAVVIEEPGNLEAIRHSIREAISLLRENSSNADE